MNLHGIFDLHIHTAPDVKERKCSDPVLAQQLHEAGYSGFAIKSHFNDTSARAMLLQAAYPDMHIAGGIVLNRSAGGLNPFAVEAAAAIGGRFVWMPTMDARSYQHFQHPQRPAAEQAAYLSLLDEDGKPARALHEVLETAAAHDLITATGHVSAREGLAMAAAAREHGVKRILITHADNPADSYTIEEQQAAVALGAMIEHCYFTIAYQKTSLEEMVHQIRAVGSENVLLSTDFGQLNSPCPRDGMEAFLQQLLTQGITERELTIMTVQNPRRLLA